MKLTDLKDKYAKQEGFADWLNIEYSDLEDSEILEIQNRILELIKKEHTI